MKGSRAARFTNSRGARKRGTTTSKYQWGRAHQRITQ